MLMAENLSPNARAEAWHAIPVAGAGDMAVIGGRSGILATSFLSDSSQDSCCSNGRSPSSSKSDTASTSPSARATAGCTSNPSVVSHTRNAMPSRNPRGASRTPAAGPSSMAEDLPLEEADAEAGAGPEGPASHDTSAAVQRVCRPLPDSQRHNSNMAEMYFIGTPPGFGRGRLMPGSLRPAAAPVPPEIPVTAPSTSAASSAPAPGWTDSDMVLGHGPASCSGSAGARSHMSTMESAASAQSSQAADAAGGGGRRASPVSEPLHEQRAPSVKASFAGDCLQWPASPRDSLRPRLCLPNGKGVSASAPDSLEAKACSTAAPPPVANGAAGGHKYKKSLIGVASLAELEAAAAALGLSARGLARTKSEDRMASWRSARGSARGSSPEGTSARSSASQRTNSPASQSPGPRVSPSKSRQVAPRSPARKANDDFLKSFLDHCEVREEMGLEREASSSSSTGALRSHANSGHSPGRPPPATSTTTHSTPQKRRPDHCQSSSTGRGRVGSSQSPSRRGPQTLFSTSRRLNSTQLQESPSARQYLLQVDAGAARERRERVGTTRGSRSSAGYSTPTAPPPFKSASTTSLAAGNSSQRGTESRLDEGAGAGGPCDAEERTPDLHKRAPEARCAPQRSAVPAMVRPPSGYSARGRAPAAGRCTPPVPPSSAAPATPQRGRPPSHGTPGRAGTPVAGGTPQAGGYRASVAGTPTGTPSAGYGTPSGSTGCSRSGATAAQPKRRCTRETSVRTSLTQRCPSLTRRLGIT